MAELYGHVKISRKAFEDDLLWRERREFSKWEAWVDMIQMAAWKPFKKLVGAAVIPLERGEILASVRFLAMRWNWTDKQVRWFLTHTIADRICVQRESEKGHIYLLVNYDLYQSQGRDKGEPRASEGHKEKQLSNQAVKDLSESEVLFEIAWKGYPERPNNPKKEAFKCWCARVSEGVEPREMLAAVDRYAKYCTASDIAGTGSVMQARTFFGPNERWRDAFEVRQTASNEVDTVKMLIKTAGMALFNSFTRQQGFEIIASAYPSAWEQHQETLKKIRYGDLREFVERKQPKEYTDMLAAQLREIHASAA